MNFSPDPLTKFERADNGERRTTQVLQLDTAEHFQASLFRVALATRGNPGSTDGHEFLAVSLKNRGNFENWQLLNARARRATPERLQAKADTRYKGRHCSAKIAKDQQ
jgi:hypothetical protein